MNAMHATTTRRIVTVDGVIPAGADVEITETPSGMFRIRGRNENHVIIRTRRLTFDEVTSRVTPA